MINRDNYPVLIPENIHEIKLIAYLADREGHRDVLAQLRFNPDNLTLTSIGIRDGKVCLWNVTAHQLENSFHAFGDYKHTILSECGRWIALTENRWKKPGELCVRCLKTGETIFSNEAGVPLIFTPDGNFLVYALEYPIRRVSFSNPHQRMWIDQGEAVEGDLPIFILNLETKMEELFISLAPDECLHFDQKCRWYIRTRDAMVYIFEFNSHKLYKTLLLEIEPFLITSVIFSPDGNYVLIARLPTDELWGLHTATKIMQFEQNPFETIHFSPDSRFLAFERMVWNISDHLIQTRIYTKPLSTLNLLTFMISNTFYFNIYADATYILNLVSSHQLKILEDQRIVALSPDNKFIATANNYGHICLWGIGESYIPEPKRYSTWEILWRFLKYHLFTWFKRS